MMRVAFHDEREMWLERLKKKSFRRARLTALDRAGYAEVIPDKPRKVRPLRIPHDFRRTAIRNLERAGVPWSSAMKMVGHKTESVYRRYAVVEATMRESGVRLQSLHDLQGATGWTGGVSGVTGIVSNSVRVPSESALTVERSR